jgi:hypothetical protein
MTFYRSNELLNRVTFLLFFLLFFNGAFAQEKDSANIYEKIREAAYKRTFTTWLYHAIFVDPAPIEYPVAPEAKEKHVNPYLKHKDQIIRNINISVYNPFGHKVQDTISHIDNILENVANHVHITTRHWIVNNRLLFKKNDTLNALTLSESERLLRSAEFISDARIYVTKIKNSDSVDVNVDVHDKWPITAPSFVSPQGGNIRFRNQNLFGVGQQFEQYVGYKIPDVFDYSGYYRIANLDNTYISSQMAYKTNVDGTSVGLSFDRAYFSPLATWAGGVFVNHDWGYYVYTDTVAQVDKKLTLNNLGYDLWAGKSFKLRKKKTLFDQSTNIIIGERYYSNTFLARPSFEIDTARYNSNTSAFVGNIGFSIQQYYKDKFIYRFGSNEDVPEGLIVQMTYGASKKEFNAIKYYTGFEIARAKKFNFGYLTSTFAYGIYFNEFIKNDITTKFNLYYLANLVKKGQWYFREFLNYTVVHGENKVAGETVTFKTDEMYGFNSTTLSGNSKMVLNFETVAYAPYNLIGFRFAGVALAGIGIVGSPTNKIDRSPLYQAYSLGLLIRNENLVSSTFQISFGFYPFLPNGNNNVFMLNPVTSFTLRVRNFSMGRPEFISY